MRLWLNDTESINLADKTDRLNDEIATRQRVNMLGSMFGYLPNPDPVLKKQGQDITVYKDLRTDAHVGSQILARKAGIQSLLWEIDKGRSKSRRAKLIQDVINGDNGFPGLNIHGLISEILDAPLYGYKFLEVIWQKHGEYIIPARVTGKPCEWFHFDEYGRPRLRTATNLMGELLPERKFLLATHDATYDNPYGFPLLSSCFWPVIFKRGGLKFWAVFTEKYGMPWVVGKYARGSQQQDVDNMLTALEDMVQDAVAVVPDDGRVEIITGSDKGSADIYERLCNYADKEVSKALLGQTLTTDIGSSGSYAASKTHSETKGAIIDSDRILVETVINQLIRWVDDLNFGQSGGHPSFVLYEEEDVDQNIADRDKTLTETGVKFTKMYYLRTYGFAEDEIEIAAPAAETPAQPPLELAESADRDEADDAADAVTDAQLQKSLEAALKPVFGLMEQSDSFEDALGKLAGLYPRLNTAELEDTLARAMFVMETAGRLQINEEV